MNMTTEQRLVEALREAFIFVTNVPTDSQLDANVSALGGATARSRIGQWREALAAYDAWPERMATDYRVTTEWDAFDANTPRAAAVEVWQRIRESAGPVFTVRCSDGRVLDVDLSDEADEGVEA